MLYLRFGLEVAINGVGDLPQAKTLINRYLERNFAAGDLIVRNSRIQQPDNHMARIQQQITEAEAHEANLTHQLQAKQLTFCHLFPTAATLTSAISGTDPSQQATIASTSATLFESVPHAPTTNKRPRLEDLTDEHEPHEADQVLMQVDDGSQVRSVQSIPPSSFFTLSPTSHA